MSREKGGYSAVSYEETRKTIRSKGESITHLGEQRAREGRGLDPLVDPKTHGGIREALNLLIAQLDGRWLLRDGPAMPIKNDLDLTSSMGGNIEIAFGGLSDFIRMVVLTSNSLLERYHVQVSTGAIQDTDDDYPYRTSEFEPDNEIERQMRMLHSERGGYDPEEEYQLSLYYAAYCTKTSIEKYDLKGYYFITGDQMGRDYIRRSLVKRVIGTDLQSEIDTFQVGKKVKEKWHPFHLNIGGHPHVIRWWEKVLGPEHIVVLPRTEYLAATQAAIIGLTEGTLDLQNVTDFLVEMTAESEFCRIRKDDARRIYSAISHIPIGAQAKLPGFDKIPPKGSIFASREDLWPIESPGVTVPDTGGEEINWKM